MTERRRPAEPPADPAGGKRTKTGDWYSNEELALIEKYVSTHLDAIKAGKHQLDPAFRVAVGVDGPNARHSVQGVWGLLRSAAGAGGQFTSAMVRGGARGGGRILGMHSFALITLIVSST